MWSMDLLWFPTVGVLVGFLAGLLGIGGGFIVVAALLLLLPMFGVPEPWLMHVAIATSLASIIATALSSSWAHHKRGGVMWRSFAWLVPGLVLGGLLGAQVAQYLTGDVLRWCVAVFCVVIGIKMALGRSRKASESTHQPTGGKLGAMGVVIGAVSALVGIGGGSLTVPTLVSMRASPVRAIGTSSACGVVIGLASAAGFMVKQADAGGMPEGTLGFVYLPAAVGVALGSVLMAPVGSAVAHHLPAKQLKRVFSVFLFVVAGWMVWS